MKSVKILEKTKPSEAVNLWIEIVEIMLKFAKSNQCPRDLKPKLIYQAEKIVPKVKLIKQGYIKSVFEDAPDPESLQSYKSDGAAQEMAQGGLNEDEMFQKLSKLPETPTFIEGEDLDSDIHVEEIVDKSERMDDHPIDIDPEEQKPTDIQDISKDLDKPPTNDSLNRAKQDIINTLDDLRKQPDNFQEIKPSPYTGSGIIGKSSSNLDNIDLDMYKKETTTLDITKSDEVHPTPSPNIDSLVSSSKADTSSESIGESHLNIAGTAEDPFKSITKPSNNLDQTPSSTNESKDPFGPKDLPENDINEPIEEEIIEDSEKKVNCYACGQKLNDGSNICPFCGTDNSI